MAKSMNHRGASDDVIRRTYDKMQQRIVMDGNDSLNEEQVAWWPGLTQRETRIIRDALMDHETVIDQDVSALFRLRSWFNANVRGEL